MLLCAVLASLALGVLVAYGVCGAMFRIFQVHAQTVSRGPDVPASMGVAVKS